MITASPRVRRLSRRAKIALVVGAVVLAAVAAAVSIIAVGGHRSSHKHAVSYSSQVALPFTHLDMPVGVAVDTAGNSYVTDYYANLVWKLAAGASVPTPLPFPGVKNPTGVAVDTGGNLYVTDGHHEGDRSRRGQ
jgi:serine/threonine-protein kinase